MKPIYIKRVIDFIHYYHPELTGRELRSILENEPEQFIYLLNEAIERAGSTPKCAIKFIKEIQKIIKETSNNTHPITKESPIMTNEIKPSFAMRLVAAAKNVWGKVSKFFSTNTKKVAVTGSAIIVALIAFFATNKTALVTLLITMKSQGVLRSLNRLWTKVVDLAATSKNFILDNLELAWMFTHLAAAMVLDKAKQLKAIIVARVKQAWQWLLGLFKPESTVTPQNQAA